MLAAVIFDFDGVITDSEILHLRAFNQVLSPFGVEMSIKEYYKDYLGLSDLDCFRSLVRENRLTLNEAQLENLLNEKKKAFEKIAKTEGKIIEGVRDFLRMLGKNNIKTAICSGSLLAEIELILDQARLRDFFDVIVSAEQVKKGKPHPEGFLLTLEKLNKKGDSEIEASQCVVIEDSHWGLESAKAAGMHTVAVTNSYDAEQLALAEKVVAHLDELKIEDLQKLCG